MSESDNRQVLLIGGESGTGKSTSLRNLRGGERVLFLNCESGKSLPFRNNFTNKDIDEPYQIHEAFEATQPGGPMEDAFDTIVIDTLTYLMDMFESAYIYGAKDSMKGWAAFQHFFKDLMQIHVKRSEKNVIFLAHTKTELNNETAVYETNIPVKGALKGNGIESYFMTNVSTKKMKIPALADYQNDMLHITEEEEMLGFKHVFQTKLTKETTGERIRSPMDMFTRKETFIDNDAQVLLDHLKAYYG